MLGSEIGHKCLDWSGYLEFALSFDHAVFNEYEKFS